MTSTISCTTTALLLTAGPGRTAPSTVQPTAGRRRLRGVGQQLLRQVARFWGSGSVTPSSQVLDEIDVPSFHR